MRFNPTLLSKDAIERPVQSPGGADFKIRWASVFLVGIVAVSLFFRVWQLDHLPGLNGDEAWSGVQALRFLHGESVAWRTPTGNLLNVFFWGPLVALHAVLPPSILLLRSVSVASGVLALAANFWLCRRRFDLQTAVVSTLVLAVLPINVAYSRFAWDASQTLLVTTCLLYAALALASAPHPRPLSPEELGRGEIGRRARCFPEDLESGEIRARKWRYAVVALLFVAALIVHPTNVFLAPLVIACAWPNFALVRRTPHFRRSVLLLALSAGIAVGWLCWPYVGAGLARLISPVEFSRFVIDLGRLFSGATVYRFISGGVTSDGFDLYDAATWSVIAFAVCGFIERARREGSSLDRALGVGLLISLVGFYLVAGPRGVMPHFERYAIWTVAPCVLLVSRGIGWWLRPACRYRAWTRAAVGLIALCLLVSFYAAYFRVFQNSGGESHLAFRTADIDPKQKAIGAISNATAPGEIAHVVSEGWWTRLPLEYLSQGHKNVNLVNQSMGEAAIEKGDRHVWFVELVGSDEERAAQQWFQNHKIPFVRREETDCAGRPVVAYFRRADNSANP